MSTTATAIIKAAAALLSSEKGRKAVGWVLVAILSPVILLIVILLSLGSGAAARSFSAVELCFWRDDPIGDSRGISRSHRGDACRLCPAG